jgi:beta-galactosidase/beta-glucuronidase
VSDDFHDYPRPQLKRESWTSLNGTWDFAFDPDYVWTMPSEVKWDNEIIVPFAPETVASGIADPGFHPVCWYRRTFDASPLDGGRLILHFGAVDYSATVWVNGHRVVRHDGGYTPFSCDITNELLPEGPQTVVVRAEDDPADLQKPRGKQDWQLRPHSIWYPRTSGIWQTVWIERVPDTYIADVRWTPNMAHWEVAFAATIEGRHREYLRLKVQLSAHRGVLSNDTYSVIAGEVSRRICLSDPGIDDYRNELLWSPEKPTLLEAQIELWGERGELVDSVSSYTALRVIAVQGDRFVLNGRPVPLRLVLDQGYWPETGMTPPGDQAIRTDITLVKKMGFNGVRKHQKIEDPRFLYWADKLGLFVWEEMPSAYRYTRISIDRVTREWRAAMERDISHPCIIAWVPFNESWGVPDLPDSPAQRHYVQALYHLTKTLDATRPVIGNDGWESVATDIIGIHDYDSDPESILRRYCAPDAEQLFRQERPGGRLLLVSEEAHTGQPLMLTEFGGIAYSPDQVGTWGYSRCQTADDFLKLYRSYLHAVRSVPLLAGFCYTQFVDTYQEATGLLFANRTAKIPIEEIEAVTSLPIGIVERPPDPLWRERMMNAQRSHRLPSE